MQIHFHFHFHFSRTTNRSDADSRARSSSNRGAHVSMFSSPQGTSSHSNNTPAQLGGWSRRTHHQVYRCGPAAAAPHSLSVSGSYAWIQQASFPSALLPTPPRARAVGMPPPASTGIVGTWRSRLRQLRRELCRRVQGQGGRGRGRRGFHFPPSASQKLKGTDLPVERHPHAMHGQFRRSGAGRCAPPTSHAASRMPCASHIHT